MQDLTGIAIIAVGVLIAALIYWLAWRATRERSLALRAAVRGGLPLLFAAPVVALALLSFEAPRTFSKIEGQLNAPTPEAEMERQELERMQAEELQRKQAAEAERARQAAPSAPAAPDTTQFGAPGLPGAAPAPVPQGSPGLAPEMAQPRVVLPPAVPEAAAPQAPSSPPAAANGDHEPDAVRGLAERSAEASAPAAAPPAQSDWDVVPVFYGTDRAEEPDPKRLKYNAERGRRLELGRALVTVPKIHEVPQIERPWALRIPYFDVTIYEQAEDPKKHFTMQEIKKLSKEDFLQLVRGRLGASTRYKDHALVFVHGYNTSFDHAVYRTAQISYDLKFDGAAFLYSWPSGGAVASYTYDRESAEAAEPYLRQFLEMVVKETGAKSISVIAHSMGNQPLLDVLKDMNSAAPAGVVISQVILAAPDVDADNFVNLARRIEGFAKGVTLYAAANDRALVISRNFWQNPRAGDVPANGPLIVPGIDTIDVTAASTDTFALNHSGYAENNALLQDIGKLILDGVRPPDQRLSNLKRVDTDRGEYWRYTVP